MRVCQFRHDGNLNCNAAAATGPPCQERSTFLFLQPCPTLSNESPHHGDTEKNNVIVFASLCFCVSVVKDISVCTPTYPSFAVIEIFAFSTFDTGQPFSAASAYF
jgi:hypothetical protein